MSDIKRYDMQWDHYEMENVIVECDDGAYVAFHAHDMAIAAKDARVAELEEMLLLVIENVALWHADYEPNARKLLEIRQQKAEPTSAEIALVAATHSEDGREMSMTLEQALDEECGRSGNAVPVGVPIYSISLPEIQAAILRAGYAQPARQESEGGRDARDFTEAEVDAAIDALEGKPARQQAEPKGCTKPDCFPYCDCGSADDYVPATHSEDGRECQHQRTHYSQRNGGEHVCSNCGESANDAQPARQVGDEPIRDDDLVLVPRGLLGAARYAIKNKVDAPNVHGQLGEYCYGQAALAPAAVVVPCRADERQSERYMNGWNSALDEVARLNRRAIPEGLIEASRRAADILGSQGFAAWDQLAAELRALLGKS